MPKRQDWVAIRLPCTALEVESAISKVSEFGSPISGIEAKKIKVRVVGAMLEFSREYDDEA